MRFSRAAKRAKKFRALVAVGVVAALLVGCSSRVDGERAVPGTEVRLAWTSELTSTNAASVTGNTPGNLDVAAMTRSQFAVVDDAGEIRPDASFGSASILDSETFTVRFALADRARWSDNVPVDAADLMLAWAAGSNAVSTEDFEPPERGADGTLEIPDDVVWFDSAPVEGLSNASEVPKRDDWKRSIDVTLDQAVPDWQTLLDVAVPAHVLGQRVFGVSDPMVAKQRVLDAIDARDPMALAPLAAEWNSGFQVNATDAEPSSLLSNAGYRIESVTGAGVSLVANDRYGGGQRPNVAQIQLQPVADTDAALAGLLADEIDVASVRATGQNQTSLRDLERERATFSRGGGAVRWELVMRADRGPFTSLQARQAFMRAIDRRALIDETFGELASEAPMTDSILFRPGTRLYSYAEEDAGFAVAFPSTTEEEAAKLRDTAGVPNGTRVCVAYDESDDAAAEMFDVLVDQVAAAGWEAVSCGASDLSSAQSAHDWNVLLRAASVANDVAGFKARWGSGGVTGVEDQARDALLREALATADQDALESTLLEIETGLVAEALTLPIAQRPQLTISRERVQGVTPRPAPAALTWNAWQWSIDEKADTP